MSAGPRCSVTPKGWAACSKKSMRHKRRLVLPTVKWQLDPGPQGTAHVLPRSSAGHSRPPPQAPSLCRRSGVHPCCWLRLGGEEGRGRGGRLCFPSPHGYLRLVFKADSGRLAQATAAECPVGIAVRRARGPVVTFLPFGGWGCQEQGQDREPRARIHRRPHPVTMSAAAGFIRDAGDSRGPNLICFCLKTTRV